MATHVAILLRPYIRLILDGRKTVESRLTRTDRAPYRRIGPGDRVYFKASAGPYMATAVAGAVEFHEGLTPAKVAALRERLNDSVCGDDPFWTLKRDSRYASFIELREVRPTREGPRIPPSRGPAWFVLDDDQAAPSHCAAAAGEAFEVVLSPGAIANGYVGVPPAVHLFDAACYGGRTAAEAGEPIALELPGGRVVQTDVVRGRNQFRWRGWRRLFEADGVRAGDAAVFRPLGGRRYGVSFRSDTGVAMNARQLPSEPPGDAPPALERFVSPRELTALVRRAREEDLGPRGLDVTSALLIPRELAPTTEAVFRSRQTGRLAGAAVLPAVIEAYDPAVALEPAMRDGEAMEPGSAIARLRGPLASVLAIERVALNFLTHLSGIATLTARYADAVAGTRAAIYDTRKTHAGLRGPEKYAVACGGGRSHRMGLHDAVLVKDNHLAHLSLEELPDALAAMMAKARALPGRSRPAFIEVEVDTLEQLARVLPLRPDVVLLDNMSPDGLREAVRLRDRIAPGVELEASGGVNLETVGAIAQTGVERIAVGAITHSAPAVDIGLDIEIGRRDPRLKPRAQRAGRDKQRRRSDR